ncbi:FG-GAP-like repeat-containing protein [Nannocystis exedens]|uniref:FG-GAP-like repeat-containing protein n=1 Tax=Nannocystis exedens TaxID=54 RepID=UPI00147650C2|nr:FG-GAP-like repeat-containing protein [Nannocystis exedens]
MSLGWSALVACDGEDGGDPTMELRDGLGAEEPPQSKPKPPPPTRSLPPRLANRKWKLTFSDDFNGWEPGKDPDCYDSTITPARCMQEGWYTGPCDPQYQAQLADLDKCVWMVHDRYNHWSYHGPNENGVNKLDPGLVAVQGGSLWLDAKMVANPNLSAPCNEANPDNCPILSGGIESAATGEWVGPEYVLDPECDVNGFCQKYGRFEIRARIPLQPGAFPAHWLLPQHGDYVEDIEIDIMESVHDGAPQVHSSVHMDPATAPGVDYRMHSKHFHVVEHEQRYAEEFHTYAVEWTPQSIAFYIDDLETGRMNYGEPHLTYVDGSNPIQWVQDHLSYAPTKPFFFILNTSVLRARLGKNLASFTPMTHEIDWVRAYEACPPDSADPECKVIGTGSAEITNDSWMTVAKWKQALRVLVKGDFNGDGADDLLLQPRALPGHATYRLTADGRGRFGNEDNLTNLSWMNEAKWYAGYRQILAGDFDGDGDHDLLLRPTGPGHAAYLLTALGNGFFADEQTVTNSYWMNESKWSTQYRQGHVVDFDGDGRDDLLLVGVSSPHHTYLLRGLTGGGFANEQTLSLQFGTGLGHWTADNHETVLGDFNGDGATDVLLRGRTGAQSTFLLNSDGAGGHLPVVDVTSASWMNAAKWADAYREARVGDFNGDGFDDLLLRSRQVGHSTYLLVADGTGGFHHEVTLDNQFWMTPVLWSHELRDAHVGDFNGDGADDLLLRGREWYPDSGHATYLLPGGGPDVFRHARDITDEQTLSYRQWSSLTHELTVGDWDGDGTDDILLRGRQGEVFYDAAMNPQDMVRITDETSDQSYVVYLPPALFQ